MNEYNDSLILGQANTPRLTLTSASATFAGTISSGAITSSGDISGSTIEGYVFPSYPSQSGGVLTSDVSGNMAWSFNTVSSYVNSGDDRIITSTSSTGIRGESNLTYNETDGLKITDSTPKLSLIPTSSSATEIILDSSVQGFINFKHGATTDASIGYEGVFNNKLSISCGNGITFGSSNLETTGTISSGAITSSGTLIVGAGTQSVAGDADITVREGNAFAGIDLRSTRTSGNIGGIRSFNSSNVGVGNLLFEVQGRLNYTGSLGFALGGTSFIDGSRNLTNIGTISSGAINVNGAGAGSIAGFRGDNYNQVNIAHSSNTSWGMLLTNSDSASNSGYHNSTSGINSSIAIVNVNNDALHFGTNNGLKFTIDHLGNLKHGTSQITIIDTSRNLTNIGTISSGAITVTNSTANAPVATFTGSYTANGDVALSEWQRSGGAVKANFAYVDSTTDMEFGTTTSHGLGIKTGNTRRLTITSAGNATFTGTISSGAITSTGNVTAYSDKRLKTNIQTLDGKKALQMRGVSFIKDGVEGSGVIAQEIEEIAPELVLTADDEMGTKSVAYGNLVGYLIETVKELKSEIDGLKARLDNDPSK